MDQNYFSLTQRAARLERLEKYSDRFLYAMSGTAAIAALSSFVVATYTHNRAATEFLFTTGFTATVPAFIGLVAAGHYAKAHATSTEQLAAYIDGHFSAITADVNLSDLADRWPIETDPTTNLE